MVARQNQAAPGGYRKQKCLTSTSQKASFKHLLTCGKAQLPSPKVQRRTASLGPSGWSALAPSLPMAQAPGASGHVRYDERTTAQGTDPTTYMKQEEEASGCLCLVCCLHGCHLWHIPAGGFRSSSDALLGNFPGHKGDKGQKSWRGTFHKDTVIGQRRMPLN